MILWSERTLIKLMSFSDLIVGSLISVTVLIRSLADWQSVLTSFFLLFGEAKKLFFLRLKLEFRLDRSLTTF